MAFGPHVPAISGVIQLAVAPVFLLTAIGTLIAALNIRLGRAVDRRRALEELLPRMNSVEAPSAQEELQTIARRIRFVYLSILCAVVSALVGQSGAGKTTLAEALLAKAGAIPAAGSVERGTTVCDYTPLEKQLQHSLKLAVASFDAKTNGEATRIHLLDTPGYPDFLGQS